jgi:hypothetical protein
MSSPAKIPAKSPLRSKSKSKSGSPSKKVNAPIKTASGTSVPAAPMPIPSSEHRLKARETTKDWKVQIYHGMDPLSQKLLLYTTIKKIPGCVRVYVCVCVCMCVYFILSTHMTRIYQS